MADVHLEAIGARQLRQTFLWLQDPDLRAAFMMREAPKRKTHFQYWRGVLSDSTQRVWAIYLRNVHVGNCGIKHIDHTRCDGELWIYLGNSSHRSKGIGHAAVGEILEKAREELRLRLVYLHVAKTNIAARRVYHRHGFIEKDARITGDSWGDRGVLIVRMERAL